MNYEIVRTDPIIELTTICVGCKMHVFVIPYSKGNILAIPTHGISADLAGLSNEIYNLEALKEIGYNEIFVSVNISSQNLSGNSEWQVRHIDI
jgi:hypothetical protein